MATPVSPARRMSAMDASFFNLERTGQLLHIAGVYTVEGTLDFERLQRELAERLHLLPRYTQRVVEVPFGLAHPTWEADPQFHIRNHVHRHTLRPPGDDEQLSKLASRLFARGRSGSCTRSTATAAIGACSSARSTTPWWTVSAACTC